MSLSRASHSWCMSRTLHGFLGLVLVGLLGLAGWGCSGKSPKDDEGKTGRGEVKKSEDAASPRDGRSGRAIGKVLRKMQADEKAEALGGPSGRGVRDYPAKTRKYQSKTPVPTWKEKADKTEYRTKTMYEDKTEGGF